MYTQKIIPNLWFKDNVKEKVDFYTSIFSDSKIDDVTVLKDSPVEGHDTEIYSFTLCNQPFVAFNGNSYFEPNPSISFFVDCDTRQEAQNYWDALSQDGQVLMGLDSYPHSELYGWIQDKHGISWQIMLSENTPKHKIMNCLLFADEQAGNAQAAADFYVSVFKESKTGTAFHHQETGEKYVVYSDFYIENQMFIAMDSMIENNFTFNEAISFAVDCQDQNQIDYYWDKLTAVPESEQCGWLKDKFGISWQIVPTQQYEMLANGSEAQIRAITQAFMQMKKFDIAQLTDAYNSVK